ncbi:TonB-dependent hemoglobin/transferrin/lactoferrin family receptor [Puniceibacterium sediminis]|uniref:Hemoglobin/transferrin/lactoferrin receptor protein n=1 Tax=Puniceibacterium sediminis TaxID=1608407 RepID=A0A238Y6E0_9RHOB|nr:TonB-dependent hemoglobin/transferrin/lactoferrin family receptor [Puniceibacterium sediminis]SNR66677.1 hemoglobin/transferrin/lactoferrin receptor protein [Puniceibacterium sediminis]
MARYSNDWALFAATLSAVQFAATAASAQDEPFILDPITVNADRAGDEALDVPANITVIDGETIEDHQISDIEELVRQVPGVTVSRQTTGTDPFNTFGGFTIRGVGGNRVAIQMDGSRIPERIMDGTRDYIDLNFTKQVDIVRGPASVLWGADALGGLVSFETVDPEDILDGQDRAVRAKAGYDSFNEGASTSLTVAQKFSPTLSLLAGVARENAHEAELSNARDDGGIYGCPRNIDDGATPCGELDPTDTQSTRALVKLVWTPTDQHRLEFSTDLLQRDTSVEQDYVLGPNSSGEVITDKDRELDLHRQRYAIEHTFTPTGGLLSELRTTLAYTSNGYTRSGTEESISTGGDEIKSWDELEYSENFLELDVQATVNFMTGAADHRMIMGFDGDITKTDYSRRDTEYNITTDTKTVTSAGGFNFANATTRRADIYLEDRITFGGGQFELTPGLRFATYKIDPRTDSDYQAVTGQEPAVRDDQRLLKSLGATYHFNDNWSVWAKYGEGFKMPIAQQLYTSLPGTFFNLTPAPGLLPEEVKSYELGLRFEEERGFFAINAFKADYTDFIQSFYNPPGTSDYTYRNLSTVNVWGLEASGALALSDRTTAKFSASWQKGEQQVNSDSDTTAHTLPPLMATLSLAHYFPNQRLSLEGVGTFASAVKDTASDTDFKPDAYAIFDAHAKWELVENGFLNISINNMFDKRYFTANAATYGTTASSSVASSNPIELQTGPGRTFAVSYEMRF